MIRAASSRCGLTGTFSSGNGGVLKGKAENAKILGLSKKCEKFTFFLDLAARMCDKFTHADGCIESKRTGSLENPLGKRRLETRRDPEPFLLAH
jgi:hypothetical protein